MTRKEMLDERMAEEWVSENGFSSDCNNINSVEANREMVNAFSAGFEAGRPKWHNVAKEALPNNYRYVWTNVGAGYYDGDCWRDAFGRLQGVFAWCEPNFEEDK